MRVTIAVCTWNRAPLLDQTLARMRELRVPAGVEWELLVVNNNSTDGTDAVIARHAGALPIRRLFESKPGLSHARNRAIAEARGSLILWTDDDVLVDPDWMAAYVGASRRWPDAGYFGGKIEPWYETPPPRWIVENQGRLEGMLVIRDFGGRERPLTDAEQPWGASMAFRRHLLDEHRFDPNLGRRRDECILGDETGLFAALRARGVVGVWVPEAKVRHFVSRERLTRSYAWSYFQGVGRTEMRLDRPDWSGDGPRVFGAPRWLVRRVLERRATALWRRLCFRRDWFDAYLQAAMYSGHLLEARRVVADASRIRPEGAPCV